MPKPRKKKYEAGDQLHFIITEDFVNTANEFFGYCDSEMLNASEAIRRAMGEWLARSRKGPAREADGGYVHVPVPGTAEYGRSKELASAVNGEEEPEIEQAFVIYRDGALLAHATNRVIPDLDMEIFSGMLTLIQGFVTESFRDIKDTGIKMIEFGERNILIEPSSRLEITLAIVYRGEHSRDAVQSIARAILYELEFTFGYQLKKWDGNLNRVRGMREVILNNISGGQNY